MFQRLAVALTAFLLCFPAAADAAWLPDGSPVTLAPADQSAPRVAPDGFGGGIVVWEDQGSGNGFDVYAQRVNADGSVLWTLDGAAVAVEIGDQRAPCLVGTSQNGAIIVWQDNQGTAGFDIRAQHLDAWGNKLWATGGVLLSGAADNQLTPRIAPDGAGGAIAVWEDYRGTNSDLFAQRIDASGSVQWTANGVPISTSADDQIVPDIIADGTGGAIVVWQDYRNAADFDIYIQHLDSGGNAMWTTGGVSLTTAANDQLSPKIATDGQGGAIVTWYDNQSGATFDIHAQRVDASGNVLWSGGGISLSATSNLQLSPTIAPDGLGGAVITWYEYQSGADYDVFAQRVDGSGALLWTTNGVSVSAASGLQYSPQIAPDGQHGAIVTWDDYRSGTDFDVYSQHIDGSGLVQWTPDGTATSEALENQTRAVIAPGLSGAFVVWEDRRSGTQSDIYAKTVGMNTTSVEIRERPGASGVLNQPNPFSRTTEIRYWVMEPSRVDFQVLTPGGRLVHAQQWEEVGAGERTIPFDGRDRYGRTLPAGVYFYRISAWGLISGSRTTAIRSMVRLPHDTN